MPPSGDEMNSSKPSSTSPPGLLKMGAGRRFSGLAVPRVGAKKMRRVPNYGWPYVILNYGWPYVTYGTDYGQKTSRWSKFQGRHDGYNRPVFAWVPSIATSNLIQVEGFSPEWDGDLLVSSLKQRSLYRIRYRENRVIFVEPIRPQ